MTDAQKMWLALKRAGTTGVHSWDVPFPTKNASQRAKDVTTKGEQVWKRAERRNGRPGVRFWLDGFQPDDAERVVPNHARGETELSSEGPPAPAHQGAAELALAEHWERDWDGEWTVRAA